MSTSIFKSLPEDSTARCPNCEFSAVPVPGGSEVLGLITCPSCEVELAITELEPLELEAAKLDPDGDEDLINAILEPDDDYEDWDLGEDDE